jgi:protein-disulfide isomerase
MERGPLLLAAAIVAAAIVVAGVLVQGALDRGTGELARVSRSLAELEGVVKEVGGAARTPTGARSGPSERERARRVSLRTDGAPTRGPAGAPVTIVEFGDFHCSYCERAQQTLARVQERYGDQVTLVFKHLPLRQHPDAPAAHAAAEAAHRQGRFWEMHDLLFADPRDLDREKLSGFARQLGLDVERFERDSASASVRERVEADLREAQQLGINGTPTFYVNGRLLAGAQPFEAFEGMIDQELASD